MLDGFVLIVLTALAIYGAYCLQELFFAALNKNELCGVTVVVLKQQNTQHVADCVQLAKLAIPQAGVVIYEGSADEADFEFGKTYFRYTGAKAGELEGAVRASLHLH